MKILRAYGGKIILWYSGSGWEYEVRRKRCYCPPQPLAMAPQYAILNSSFYAWGRMPTMRDARRTAICLLQNRVEDEHNSQERRSRHLC